MEVENWTARSATIRIVGFEKYAAEEEDVLILGP